jgi:hypothetical protein
MSSAVIVRFERFQEYRQKRNRLPRNRHEDFNAGGPPNQQEAVAVAAVAVRDRVAAEEPRTEDFTD